jgi:KDO2-lipid IV(A) lauroyltransferase
MYYIVYGLLWPFSILPFRVLHFLADCIYGLVFYVFKYRRKVVLDNLAIAFPGKTGKERWQIAKEFYHNMIDTFMESIKFMTITKKQILKRSSGDFTLLHEFIKTGKNLHLMAGHQFNWEFANALTAIKLEGLFVGIYMPIANKALDKIFYNFRKKWGTILISATDFKNNKNSEAFNSQYALGLAADQNPGHPANAYWMHFMGKPAPFVTGPGKGAVKNNTAVIMVGMHKRKRGYYHFSTQLLAAEGSKHTPEELTKLYRDALEQVINADPSNYLWSHRRWKYEWKAEYGPMLD